MDGVATDGEVLLQVGTNRGMLGVSGAQTAADASCGEPAASTLVLSGAQEVHFEADAATNCDGCLPWTRDDGGFGWVCF
jgi:hypothetical protein